MTKHQPLQGPGANSPSADPQALNRAGLLALVSTAMLLAGCLGTMPVPLAGLNRQLEQAGGHRDPALGDGWLAVIEQRGGRQQVVLIDLRQQRPVAVPGLNRPDALPISVGVDGRGERLALVRQLEGRSEVVLYRRSLMSLQPIAMGPGAIPTAVQLRADGRQLAVQVSRQGLWQIDLLDLP
ncbi:MAG: hypothetical protein VKM92_03645 [Cyanobacteriota bacterium]|nr:hypothetical protein [Cyanobacteriota bacterium]